MKNQKYFLSFFVIFLLLASLAASMPVNATAAAAATTPSAIPSAAPSARIQGEDLFSGVASEWKPKKNGSVILFLSAHCPCSNSHVEEIKNLAKEYADYQFIGVHSNLDETVPESRAYFKKADFGFPIIEDKKTVLADQYKAFKTPHAFVISADDKILYRGGVSNSHEFSASTEKYLREALTDIKKGLPVRVPEGRTLGCTISRGEKNVW